MVTIPQIYKLQSFIESLHTWYEMGLCLWPGLHHQLHERLRRLARDGQPLARVRFRPAKKMIPMARTSQLCKISRAVRMHNSAVMFHFIAQKRYRVLSKMHNSAVISEADKIADSRIKQQNKIIVTQLQYTTNCIAISLCLPWVKNINTSGQHRCEQRCCLDFYQDETCNSIQTDI